MQELAWNQSSRREIFGGGARGAKAREAELSAGVAEAEKSGASAVDNANGVRRKVWAVATEGCASWQQDMEHVLTWLAEWPAWSQSRGEVSAVCPVAFWVRW